MSRPRKNSGGSWLVILFAIVAIVNIAGYALMVGLSLAIIIVPIVGIVYGSWKLYESMYFNGKSFKKLRASVEDYIKDCNELNSHIEELRISHIGFNHLYYGQSSYKDESRYDYKRPELNRHNVRTSNVCNCSRSVCDSSRMQPFKYLCKYFDIKPTEENLEVFENLLNNYEAAEEGRSLVRWKKDEIMCGIENDIPAIIKHFSADKIEKNLGFREIKLEEEYFPKYIFRYVSSGGNASLENTIEMNTRTLNSFITYLSDIVKFRKSAAGQRALMTSSLRKKILIRDNYTCQECGLSKRDEAHLLLEIDHIKPISKGGLTTEDNLQVLCWRCNRKKGSKTRF